MLFKSFVCGLTFLASSISALSIPTFEDVALELDKRQSGSQLPVTGAGGAVSPRLEIRQLQSQAANQYTLFVLALDQFEKQAQTGIGSYYQISGIHGTPRVNWDGVGQCSTCDGADGYCPHSSILFLGWHRAYLALFEQRLVAIAKNIANQYPTSTRATMVAAANKLRLPYWDWAARPASGNSLPTQLTNAQVTVNGPTGSKTIKNPLHHHTFRNPGKLVYTPFTNWPNTLRYPTSNAADATSQMDKAIQAFNNNRASLQDQLYQIFSTCDEFIEVGSNQQGQSSSRCSNSLEALHNTVHNAAGGKGHMTYLSVSAFDPIFWLHHCNVDRLFAMWQAVYPNSYTGSQVAAAKTWTVPKGSTQNVNSPLAPFHRNAAGDFWTTTSVRDWKQFGYTYPEFSNSAGTKAAIQGYINRLYGPSASATAGSSKRDTTPLVANNGSLFQYVANVQAPRYSLGGSYSIYLFNGEPTEADPADYILDANLIGTVGVLSSEDMQGNDLVISGSIPLTRTLTEVVSAGGLSNLAEDTVVPFLTKSLKWKIVGPDDNIVDPDSLTDFEISVYASTATPPAGSELPVWSEFIPLADITEDKAGGATLQTLITNGTTSARM